MVVVIVIGKTIGQLVKVDRMKKGRVIIAGSGLIKGRGVVEVGGVVQNVAVNARGHDHFQRQLRGIAAGENTVGGQRFLRVGIAHIIRAARAGKSHLASRARGGAIVSVAPGADDQGRRLVLGPELGNIIVKVSAVGRARGESAIRRSQNAHRSHQRVKDGRARDGIHISLVLGHDVAVAIRDAAGAIEPPAHVVQTHGVGNAEHIDLSGVAVNPIAAFGEFHPVKNRIDVGVARIGNVGLHHSRPGHDGHVHRLVIGKPHAAPGVDVG